MITLQINLHLEHILHIEYKESWEFQKILYKDGRHYEVFISNKDLRWIKKYFVCRKRKGTKNLVFINPDFANVHIHSSEKQGVVYPLYFDDNLCQNEEILISDILEKDKSDEQKIYSLIDEIVEKKKDFHKIKHHRKGKAFDDAGYKAFKPFNLKEHKARNHIYTRMFKEK